MVRNDALFLAGVDQTDDKRGGRIKVAESLRKREEGSTRGEALKLIDL